MGVGIWGFVGIVPTDDVSVVLGGRERLWIIGVIGALIGCLGQDDHALLVVNQVRRIGSVGCIEAICRRYWRPTVWIDGIGIIFDGCGRTYEVNAIVFQRVDVGNPRVGLTVSVCIGLSLAIFIVKRWKSVVMLCGV